MRGAGGSCKPPPPLLVRVNALVNVITIQDKYFLKTASVADTYIFFKLVGSRAGKMLGQIPKKGKSGIV